eukprot:7098407-Prymnesium_polylepis.1
MRTESLASVDSCAQGAGQGSGMVNGQTAVDWSVADLTSPLRRRPACTGARPQSALRIASVAHSTAMPRRRRACASA